ncbi:hypothetical protein [Kitasatospora herbaricolor]|uniref:hypothetical protein n=1 Tax=Kitasatospora herbaricolor TaxID=68217 RepID=UPI0036D894D4
MSPARTTTPRRSRAAKKTATNTPTARPAAQATTSPKTPAQPPQPAPVRPAADPILADAADRAADLLTLAEDQALTVLKSAARAAGRELATAGQWAEEAEQLRADAATEAEAITQRADRAAGQILAQAQLTAQELHDAALADAARTRDRADTDAGQRLAATEENAAELTRAATDTAARITTGAQGKAGALTGAAEQRAEAILTDARRRTDTLLADAEQAAAGITRAAGKQAEQIRAQAQRDATELRTRAERRVAEVREDAVAQADTLLADARTRAAGLLEGAREQAEELRRGAQTDADRVRGEARQLREEADREIDQATDAAREVRAKAVAEAEQVRAQAAKDVRQLRTQTAAEAARLLEEASKDASRMIRETEKAAGAAKAESAEALEKAKQLEAAALEAKDRADLAHVAAQHTLQQATSRTARKLEKRRLKREARAAERAGKPTLSGRVKAFVKANSKRLLAIVPITAPMAVAWTGQAGFAHDILKWVAPFTILFAAAWELSTAFVAWMYHEARQGGDSGTLYRVATWVFAVGAAVMNYWHASATVTGHKWDPATLRMVDQISYWDPTPKAVAFSVMSITGMVLWELYARLIHRQKLRADGKVAKSRPTIGLIRWARYPGHSFAAWSLAITDESLSTVELAWTAAANHRALVRRTGLGPVRRIAANVIGVGDWVPVRALPRVPNSSLALAFAGSANPAAVPQFAVRLTRAGSPNRFANQYSTSANPVLPAARSGSQGGRRELETANPAKHIGRSGEPVAADPEPRTGTEQGQRAARTSGEPALSAGSNRRSAAQVLADEQVQQVLALIDELGYDAVLLDVVIEKTGMKRTTAHHRLAEARKEFTNRTAAAKQFANQGSA